MQEITLSASIREVPTKELNHLRQEGKIPVELYGNSLDNQHLTVNKKEFDKVYQAAGQNHLVTLKVDNGVAVKSVIHALQFDPLSGSIDHVDLFRVNMKKEMVVNVNLVIIGESKAVKELGATLITPIETLEISCLPDDLISQIEVDITPLAAIGDGIRVADLKIPANLKVLTPLDNVVALAAAQKVEVEAKPEVAAVVEGAEGAAAEGAESAPAESKDKKDKEEKK